MLEEENAKLGEELVLSDLDLGLRGFALHEFEPDHLDGIFDRLELRWPQQLLVCATQLRLHRVLQPLHVSVHERLVIERPAVANQCTEIIDALETSILLC